MLGSNIWGIWGIWGMGPVLVVVVVLGGWLPLTVVVVVTVRPVPSGPKVPVEVEAVIVVWVCCG